MKTSIRTNNQTTRQTSQALGCKPSQPVRSGTLFPLLFKTVPPFFGGERPRPSGRGRQGGTIPPSLCSPHLPPSQATPRCLSGLHETTARQPPLAFARPQTSAACTTRTPTVTWTNGNPNNCNRPKSIPDGLQRPATSGRFLNREQRTTRNQLSSEARLQAGLKPAGGQADSEPAGTVGHPCQPIRASGSDGSSRTWTGVAERQRGRRGIASRGSNEPRSQAGRKASNRQPLGSG